ncbi:MAG: hypothetical protein KDK65_01560 [Chlamydiia bacterium]|nr:hypothetical protein [Chlamydiia bacterium]
MKQKKRQTEIVLDESPFAHQLADFFRRHGQSLLITGAVIVCLLVASLWLSSRETTDALADYTQAETLSTQISQGKGSVTDLIALVQERPEIAPSYDATIIRQLLVDGNATQATDWANRKFARLSDEHIPHYLSFSRISLLISQGHTQEALEKAQELLASLGDQPLLYAFTLLQIDSLNKGDTTARQAFLAAIDGNPTPPLTQQAAQIAAFTLDPTGTLLPTYLKQ